MVQSSKSSQDLGLKVQPVLGSQLSVVHELASSQSAAGPGMQVPAVQKSLSVQALPSRQG